MQWSLYRVSSNATLFSLLFIHLNDVNRKAISPLAGGTTVHYHWFLVLLEERACLRGSVGEFEQTVAITQVFVTMEGTSFWVATVGSARQSSYELSKASVVLSSCKISTRSLYPALEYDVSTSHARIYTGVKRSPNVPPPSPHHPPPAYLPADLEYISSNVSLQA
ncbi:hypothetical protein BC629DRAFT_1444166 [Irpex lacteus]|nr:hypothetical protein BC629DRAFT_1444166 [Irpex lacteus]